MVDLDDVDRLALLVQDAERPPASP